MACVKVIGHFKLPISRWINRVLLSLKALEKRSFDGQWCDNCKLYLLFL